MGPICIAPELKRKGYGKISLDYSLEKAKELGCGAVCFEGNIDFYGKSGFRQASEFGIRYHGLPEGEDASFFLCEELMPGYLNGITGEYAPPAGYLVNEKEAEAFDREFPYMENPIRLYSLDEITEIFCKLGLRICNSFADFSGKPSSDNDIQLMVYSIRE